MEGTTTEVWGSSSRIINASHTSWRRGWSSRNLASSASEVRSAAKGGCGIIVLERCRSTACRRAIDQVIFVQAGVEPQRFDPQPHLPAEMEAQRPQQRVVGGQPQPG